MRTNRHENDSFPRIFKGLQEHTGRHKKCGALPAIKPYLLPIRFHGVRPLRRKENSSRGACRRLRVQLRYRTSSQYIIILVYYIIISNILENINRESTGRHQAGMTESNKSLDQAWKQIPIKRPNLIKSSIINENSNEPFHCSNRYEGLL